MSKNVAVNVMSQEQARQLFTYDKDTGALRWKVRASRNVFAGDVAGAPRPGGYWVLGYQGKQYKVHNLVWNYHYGNIPDGKTIDHSDRNKTNNRVENLVPASLSRQQRNRLHRGFKRSGSSKNPWRAEVFFDSKKHSLGSFTTALQARLAYERKVRELMPELSLDFFTQAINQLIQHSQHPTHPC